MLDIVLYEPEIPPNTGSVMRLAANTGAGLSLIEPLGFELDDARLRRAGLDYREYADVRVYPGLDAYLERARPPRVFAFSARARVPHTDAAYRAGDALLFGPESRGLPDEVLERFPGRAPAAHSHAPALPQPESLQRGGGGRVRGLAAVGVPLAPQGTEADQFSFSPAIVSRRRRASR